MGRLKKKFSLQMRRSNIPKSFERIRRHIQNKLKRLFTGTIEQMLEAEMDEHFGYEKNSVAGNGRNGYGKKVISNDYGECEIAAPNENFIDYLKNVLAPTLRDDDIIVMDNMRTHHSRSVKKVIEELKFNVIYLPPYSPDFNPIKKMWSKIKAVLRKLKARSISNLAAAVNVAFKLISPDDCSGWFSSCFIGC